MRNEHRRGQSLIEVLIAITVGVILVGAAVALILPVLRSGGEVTRRQVGNALAKELLERVRTMSEGGWWNVYGLTHTSSTHYHVGTSTVPFSAVLGEEKLIIATTTYTRYFYIDGVCREASGKGDIVVEVPPCTNPPNGEDPSTQKVTVVFSWVDGPTSTISQYITRYQNRSYIQTDWSGGLVPINQRHIATTSVDNRFASSTNVDTTSSTGGIVIDGY